MSATLTPEAILFSQRLLRAAGFYSGALDGIHGPKTAAAQTAWDKAHDAISSVARWDRRTSSLLRTLLPAAHRQAANCLASLIGAKLRPRIISGTRTYPEQDQLYRIGRRGVQGEKPVTRARGGQSNHNFGIAWDIGLFSATDAYYSTDLSSRQDDDYSRLGSIWKPAAIEWGGDWSFPDRPHYQLRSGLSLQELRQQFEAGTWRLLDN